MENAALSMKAMRNLREVLGDLYPEQGYVSHDKYTEAVNVLVQARRQVLSDLLGDPMSMKNNCLKIHKHEHSKGIPRPPGSYETTPLAHLSLPL